MNNDPYLAIEPKPPIEYVGFGRRMAARVIDIVYHWIAALAFVFLGAIGVAILDEINNTQLLLNLENSTGLTFSGMAIGLLASAAYHTLLEGIHGSSLGKMILGITVRRSDLGRCTIWPAFIRSVAMLVDGLFFGVIGAIAMSDSDTRQRVGDRWAKTVVIRKHSVPKGHASSFWRFALGFSLASIAYLVSSFLTVWLKVNNL